MRNFGAEFLTVLPTYLEPRAFAADNAWPLCMLSHWLSFSFLMTPSSSTQANMWRGRIPCIARHESSWTSPSLSCDARPGSTRPPDQRAAGPGGGLGRTSALPRKFRGSERQLHRRRSRDPRFRLSQITWQTSVAHHPTEDRCSAGARQSSDYKRSAGVSCPRARLVSPTSRAGRLGGGVSRPGWPARA